jgi:hypothetical protein
MSDLKVSIVAASIRPQLWNNMSESLLSNQLGYEVIMVGPNAGIVPPRFRHILIDLKPVQCYEIGFRNATGELVTWSADDACYAPGALDNAYHFWKLFQDEKTVVAFRTIEDGVDLTEEHRFIYRDRETPRLAPFGLMSRKLFLDLGGYDRRFIGGQSENDLVMRVYEAGGKVEVCPNASVRVDHRGGHLPITMSAVRNSYSRDRELLERLWTDGNGIRKNRLDPVERFSGILVETQGVEVAG